MNIGNLSLNCFKSSTLLPVVILLSVLVSVCSGEESTIELGISNPISAIIIELATNELYDEAFHLIDSVIAEHPDNPYGHLLRATVLSGRAVDFEDNLDDAAILEACTKVHELSSELNPDTSASLQFYLGMADMFSGLVMKREGKLYRFFKLVARAGRHLEKANELDPELWDVYHGLGMYRYYRSKNAGILRSIGIIEDQRDEGLRNIETAVKHGTLTPVAARNSLAWIDLENKNYDRAVERSKQSLVQYPNRRAFQWCLGKALAYSKRWEEAIPVFSSILESVHSFDRNNRYNELTCLYFLTSAYYAAGNHQKVLELSEIALQLELNDVVRSRKKNDIQELHRMRDECLLQSSKDN